MRKGSAGRFRGARGRLLLATAGACVFGASVGALGQSQARDAESQTIVTQHVAVIRQQCLQTARDVTLVALRARDEQQQRDWCDATRDARRNEFAAAFVESVRRAKDGGNGLAKELAEFLRKTPDAIKPYAATTGAVCVDEKLRIDEALLEPVVDQPSIVGTLLGVNLNGKRVSRLDPVPRWKKLLKEGLVLRSPQMSYKVPVPVANAAERGAAIQTAQESACPSPTELDRALASHAATAGPSSDAAATERDASDFVTSLLADSTQRRRLGPLIQTAQSSAALPGLSASCDRDLRVLLSDNELARRITVEFVRLVDPRSLRRVLDVRQPLGRSQLFSMDGQLRLFHPGDELEQARVTEIYGSDGRAAFVVDTADVTVAATQATALGLYEWSSARSDLIARGCLPGRP